MNCKGLRADGHGALTCYSAASKEADMLQPHLLEYKLKNCSKHLRTLNEPFAQGFFNSSNEIHITHVTLLHKECTERSQAPGIFWSSYLQLAFSLRFNSFKITCCSKLEKVNLSYTTYRKQQGKFQGVHLAN